MSASTPSLKAPLFIIVSVLAFGLGMILVIAAQKSTENRSQASLGPYTCATACSPASGGPGGAACLACVQANTTPEPCATECSYANGGPVGTPCLACKQANATPPPPRGNPWADCAQWGADGKCNYTYWQKQEALDNDWRCKAPWIYYDLCEYSTGPQEMPQEPRPAEDPGINPGEETF